jgi:hypothetical protein
MHGLFNAKEHVWFAGSIVLDEGIETWTGKDSWGVGVYIDLDVLGGRDGGTGRQGRGYLSTSQ